MSSPTPAFLCAVASLVCGAYAPGLPSRHWKPWIIPNPMYTKAQKRISSNKAEWLYSNENWVDALSRYYIVLTIPMM